MPKLVDHDLRRKELLEAVWRIIARSGIAAATTREIAREAGVSNGVLAHYFPDKDTLLTEAMRVSYQQYYERTLRSLDGLTGLDAVRVIVLEALPIDEGRVMEAQVGVSFWGLALGSQVLVDAQQMEWERYWDLLFQRVDEAHHLGEIDPRCRPAELTHELIALVEGLSAEAVLYPQRVPADRQVAIIEGILSRVRAEQ